jgi:NAD(P)-dependent dehydrogenase (short-subunit alcohol dehydrogenase family)
MDIRQPFDFSGKVAVVTGGGGVLCSAMAGALAECGASVVVLGLGLTRAGKVAAAIRAAGGTATAMQANVLEKATLETVAARTIESYGHIDILINGAGGARKEATTSPQLPFFDLPEEAVRYVFDLNLLGTILPSQVFGKMMVEKGEGVILNISSMNAFRPLTRIPAYSAAKAGVSNFTQWLAVHVAQEYSPRIRVNAIAPGFFLTTQNKFLMTDKETGNLTARGKTIIGHTPMGRFGEPADLFGAVLWLLSPASAFVTGVVVPVDGGFSAFAGV